MGHYIQWTRGPGTRGPWSRDPGTRDLGPGTQGSKLACTVHVHTVDSNLLAVNGNICSTCTLRYHVYLSPNLVKIFESRLRLHGSKHKKHNFKLGPCSQLLLHEVSGCGSWECSSPQVCGTVVPEPHSIAQSCDNWFNTCQGAYPDIIEMHSTHTMA